MKYRKANAIALGAAALTVLIPVTLSAMLTRFTDSPSATVMLGFVVGFGSTVAALVVYDTVLDRLTAPRRQD